MSAASWTRPCSRKSEHRALAEALDVHRAARRRSARCAGQRWPGQSTLVQNVSLSPSSARRAARAHTGHVVGNFHGFEPFGPLGEHRAHDLGDHVAGLAHDRPCRRGARPWPAPGPRCAAWPARRSSRRRTPARASANGVAFPVRPIDTMMSLQRRGALLGRELVGDRPPRRLARGARARRAARGRRPSRRRRRSRRRGRGGAPASACRTRRPRRACRARGSRGSPGGRARAASRASRGGVVNVGPPSTSPSW